MFSSIVFSSFVSSDANKRIYLLRFVNSQRVIFLSSKSTLMCLLFSMYWCTCSKLWKIWSIYSFLCCSVISDVKIEPKCSLAESVTFTLILRVSAQSNALTVTLSFSKIVANEFWVSIFCVWHLRFVIIICIFLWENTYYISSNQN